MIIPSFERAFSENKYFQSKSFIIPIVISSLTFDCLKVKLSFLNIEFYFYSLLDPNLIASWSEVWKMYAIDFFEFCWNFLGDVMIFFFCKYATYTCKIHLLCFGVFSVPLMCLSNISCLLIVLSDYSPNLFINV